MRSFFSVTNCLWAGAGLKTLSVPLLVWATIQSAPVHALEELDDIALDNVEAAGGINFALQNFILEGSHNITISPDSSGSDTLTLQDLEVNNGSGGGVNIGSFQNPITIDVDGGGNGFIRIALPAEASDGVEPIYLQMGDVTINGFSLGGVLFHQLDPQGTVIDIAAHGDGISVGLGLRVDLGTAQVASAASTATFTGVHIGSTVNAGSDPRYPNGNASFDAWDISEPWELATLSNAPLKIDVGTNNGSDPNLFLSMTSANSGLSDKGFIRVENVRFESSPHFAGANLGPVAVDGFRLVNFTAKLPR